MYVQVLQFYYIHPLDEWCMLYISNCKLNYFTYFTMYFIILLIYAIYFMVYIYVIVGYVMRFLFVRNLHFGVMFWILIFFFCKILNTGLFLVLEISIFYMLCTLLIVFAHDIVKYLIHWFFSLFMLIFLNFN